MTRALLMEKIAAPYKPVASHSHMSTSLPANTPASSDKSGFFNLLVLLGTGFAIWMAVWRMKAFSFFVYDDSYIGLRYVANFLHTGHFEWNVGEAVEGYTDPLRLFLLIIPGALGMDLLEAARALNWLAYAGFVLVMFFALRPRLGTRVALLPAALAAAYPPLMAWVWGALDPPLTAFFIGCLQAVMLKVFLDPSSRTARMAAWTGVFCALALLVRLDSALFAVPAAVVWFLLPGKDKKPFLVFCGVVGGVVMAQEAARLLVYGDWLPNTFYSKVTGNPGVTFETGLKYLGQGFADYPFFYAVGAFALLQGIFFRQALRGFTLYALGGIVLSALYIASVGGDFMPGQRFMMPWLPAYILCLGLLLEKYEDTRKMKVMRYAGLVLCFVFLKSVFVLSPDLHSIDITGVAGEKVGKYIAEKWPKNSTVALNAAGVIPYVNLDKRFIDMLGLNDRTIARRAMPNLGLDWQKVPGHGKGDGAYVLKRAPDFIIFSSVAGDNGLNTPVFASDMELNALPEFHRCYHHETAILSWPDIMIKQKVLPILLFPFGYYRRVCR